MIKAFEDRLPTLASSAYIAEGAVIIGEVSLDEESSVWYGAVLRADIAPIRVGRASNIQDGTVIHVDRGVPCTIGEGVTVGHRAVLHGCSIGDYSMVGMGAVILNGAVVGPESIVGASALVTQGKSFPPRSLIMGSPARLVRELRSDEVESLHEHALAYVELARRAAQGSRDLKTSSR